MKRVRSRGGEGELSARVDDATTTRTELDATTARPGVTIADVAGEAGVSIATVSRVLNDAGYPVKPATRDRVLAAIDKLEFRPNELARGLLLKRTRTLGLLIPDIANGYYHAISRGVEDVAAERDHTVVFCNTDRDAAKSQRYIETLLNRRVDGIIIGGGGVDFAAAHRAFSRANVPAVFVGRPRVDWPSVQIDNVAAAATATTHLTDLGHVRIAMVAGPPELQTTRDRVRGFRQALAGAGLDPDPAPIQDGDFDEQGGYEAAARLLDQGPTAIFAANDRMALGALAAAADRGLRLPQDLSLVGFDDIEMARFARPALTTVSLPLHAMGETAARLLLDQLPPAATPTQVPSEVLTTELVIRQSTGPPPRGDKETP